MKHLKDFLSYLLIGMACAIGATIGFAVVLTIFAAVYSAANP